MSKNTTDLDKTPAPRDPDDFDIDGWIDGATTETQTVRIYRNLGKLGEYQRLEHEFTMLRAQIEGASDDADAIAGDTALGEATPLTRLQELAPKMKAVYDALQADALWVTVRGVPDDELERLRRKVNRTKLPDKPAQLVLELISAGATFRTDDGHEFEVPVGKLRKMRHNIGDKQFRKIARAVDIANGFDQVDEVVPDFSPAASVYLETSES